MQCRPEKEDRNIGFSAAVSRRALFCGRIREPGPAFWDEAPLGESDGARCVGGDDRQEL